MQLQRGLICRVTACQQLSGAIHRGWQVQSWAAMQLRCQLYSQHRQWLQLLEDQPTPGAACGGGLAAWSRSSWGLSRWALPACCGLGLFCMCMRSIRFVMYMTCAVCSTPLSWHP